MKICACGIVRRPTWYEMISFVSLSRASGRAVLDAYRDDEGLLSLMVFAVLCLPLIWYFLIDRLREISGAISGRDQQH